MRRLIIILIAVVVLVGVVFGILLSNVDHYRPRVQAELQKKLNRPVTLGKLGLKLIPLSVSIDGLTIGESPAFGSSRPFATSKDVYLSVGLFSLIGGNPEVKSLKLDHPQIELIRNAQGVWNFSTLGEQDKSSDSSSLTLNSLKINDGQIALTDLTTREPRSVYDHIDVNLTDFAPKKRFGLKLAAHLPGAGKELLAFDGKVGPLPEGNMASVPVDGKVSLQEVSLAAANRFASGSIPERTDGVLSGETNINSEGNTLAGKGNLRLENAMIRGAKLAYPIEAQYDLSADRKQDIVNIRSGTVKLGSTSFALSGTANTGAKPAQLDMRVKTNGSSLKELAQLAGSLGVAFDPAYQVTGTVSADITAKGPVNAPQLNGSLDAKNLQASGGEIKLPVMVPEIALTLTPDTIRSNSFQAKSGSTVLGAAFALSQYTTPNRTVDATIKTSNADIAELLNIAKAYGADLSKGMTGSGKLSLDAHVQGPMAQASKLAFSGTGSVAGATITTPSLTKPLSVSSANLRFSQNSVAIDNLAASAGSTSVHGNLAASNFAAPQVQFALSADQINTTELQQLMAPSKTQPSAAKEPSILDRTTGSGTLAANTIKADELTLNNVRANCKLDRGVVQLSPLTADVFGGKESGTVSLDTRPARPLCSVNAKLSGADTNALLSAVSSMKNTLYGSLATNANLRFALGSSTELARSLNGTLNFNVANGQLKNVNILNELSKVGKFLGAAPSQGGNSTALKQLSGTMDIRDGLASTNNLKAVLDAGSLAATGTLNLVDQAINMHATAVLAGGPSQAVGGSHVGGFMETALANNKGELVLPVLVTGTTAHPVFAPDTQALAKMKLNNLLPTVSDPSKLVNAISGKQGVGGIMNGLLGGGNRQPNQNGAQQQQQQQPSNPVDSILQQFGRKKKQ
ncbi:MAG: AsmA family protein [Acidobacteriaceae bacterium]|nr:AsmA family protein [Acidobacteriaceae bacterium]